MLEYQFFINILTYSIVPTIVALYVTEKVKGSIKNTFNKKLEDVKKEHSIEIANFQTELNSLKTKENFKFTKLHEKKLEVLEKTYQYINESSESLMVYVSPLKFGIKGGTSAEVEKMLIDDCSKAFDEFTIYFKRNLIYFDVEIVKLLENFFKEAIIIFASYDRNKSLDDKSFSLKEINNNLVPIKKEIEIKFRELLGE